MNCPNCKTPMTCAGYVKMKDKKDKEETIWVCRNCELIKREVEKR